MSVKSQCPFCGTFAAVADDLVGQTTQCPTCGEDYTVVAAPGGKPAPTAGAAPAAGTAPAGFGKSTAKPGAKPGAKPAANPLGNPNPLGTAKPAGTAKPSGTADPLGAAKPLGAVPGRPGAKPAPGKKGATPWYQTWQAMAGIAAGVTLLIVGGLLVVFMMRGEPKVAVAPASPPTAAKPSTAAPSSMAIIPVLKLTPPAPLTVGKGGKATATITVDRGSVKGPIELVAEGLPPKVTAKPVTIAADQSTGTLELTAAPDAADAVTKVRVVATSGPTKTQGDLPLTVKKIIEPEVSPLETISIAPGGIAGVDVSLEKGDLQGAAEWKLAGLPAKVTGAITPLGPDEPGARLQLTAAADAPEGIAPFKITATLAGKTLEREVKMSVEKFPFKLGPAPIQRLKPGETKLVDVAVQRNSYAGPISLKLDNLPENVSAEPLEIPAGQTAGKIKLVVKNDAPEAIHDSTLLLKGGKINLRDRMTIRVIGGERGALPKGLVIEPEFAHLFRRGSFGGRLEFENKKILMEMFGGNAESEAAVHRGLAWLANHQDADGSWSLAAYDKAHSGCDCKIAAEKEVKEIFTAGTAFGLLPFLGSGITHKHAPKEPSYLAAYQSNVKKGLDFLISTQVKTQDPKTDGELPGGMYAHAIGTIALCEAYAMSQDPGLRIPSQRATKYLLNAQHGSGSWGYGPRQPGDTSIVGWVFLAIRTGQLSGMNIESEPLTKAGRFLNTVACGPSEAKASRYSYKAEPANPTPAITAAGLLTRQYLGWPIDQPMLEPGCKFLMQSLPPESGDKLGPVYMYYYATQVLHHMEGDNWDVWNQRMRDHLIRTQERSGHKAGSWSPEGADWGPQGGRMYSTCFALLTLEVYYRHLPLYRWIDKAPTTDKPKDDKQAAN